MSTRGSYIPSIFTARQARISYEHARRKEKIMIHLRKPLVTLALASSAFGLSLGVGLDPADAATHVATTTTASSPSSAPMAAASLSRNTPDVEDDWTVEWQIMSTTSSSSAPSQPAAPSRSGSAGPFRL